MNSVLITGAGYRIRKRGDVLTIETGRDSEVAEPPRTLSPLGLDLLAIAGDHSISTAAVRLVTSHGGSIALMDGLGNPFGHFLPLGRSALIEQYESQASAKEDRKLEIARSICFGALENKVVLLSNLERIRGFDLSREIERIRDAHDRVSECKSSDSLRGVEGSGAHAYFQGLSHAFDDKWGFLGRYQNPASDPVNSLLSYGYGMLYIQSRQALVLAGFSPYYGAYHETYKNQEALVYDLVEEFRQPVVDRTVITFLAKHMATPDDFSYPDEGGCLIGTVAKKKFAGAVLARIHGKVSYEDATFQEIFKRQAERLGKALTEGSLYTPYRYRI
ncbi:CRISPR-associated endonuclease Cas1 [Methanospirillum sp. J.3.6.1-F.2.7.3]|jgi:CRISPR-associated protein Cas1|uniref:CRISPR-associated endonuclease Cas1 n=1 Tax=Methanospirillum purgamenti TaxID=2834276 RepID=A0A8E7B3S3_9EURY|nr:MULTISPECIES: CRISPR-associated endonuclease Cas1 [Methanospirillum]MDX8551917.1 CRISPR-associated endonuclease Cas1 [Methanospirillum hungatei]QVV89841.1 CRISPR-associated endonuclease Cas1 [Methanospirillum sp. J.3.6.1-F.2.7.3]